MYVLCTLAVLALHSLLRKRLNSELDGTAEAAGKEEHLEDGGISKGRRRRGGAVMAEERRCGIENVSTSGRRVQRPDYFLSCRLKANQTICCAVTSLWVESTHQRRSGGGGATPLKYSAIRMGRGFRKCDAALLLLGKRREEPVQRSSALFSPAVMFGTRKTWDIGHAPCLQELWKKDISLDASSVDFLMSDGEDEGSFLSLPAATFSQRPSLNAELNNTNSSHHQLLIKTLQDKVCEFQAHLCSEEVSRHQLLQQTGGGAQTLLEEPLLATPNRGRLLQPTQRSDCFSRLEEEQLVLRLRTQVKELEEKLLDQTQEAERLRSELLERLLVENERLKQELKSCRSSEFQKLDAAAGSCSCSHCPRSQVSVEVGYHECALKQLGPNSLVSSTTFSLAQEVEALRREVSHWESQARQREQQLAELGQELQEKSCRVEAMQQQLDDSKRQLEDSRKRRADGEHNLHLRLQECEEELARRAATPPRVKVKNGALQEQLSVQRQLLRELETQLHESQRTCTQLRTQVSSGVRMNLLSLQPALRTLTSDYNCLKKQVQDFPSMLDKAISEAKQEICQVISDVSSTNQELLRKYKREMNLRKKCHNELVRLKGNIRVFCRVRPVSQVEQDSADARTMLSFDSDDDAILYLSNKGKIMTFELDKVFPPQASQEEGIGDNPGINQRALRLLFSEVMEKAADWDYRIIVSMVEIYNETLR
ncbi:hypothetical protein GOODEAATRI_007203 [Goodea atripinnis]|uniref:Kinesin motor domain-containing protein n=1 Tax=Goodea atripinnis TaxID=208336 RepID=A0ABV0N8P0_9TELE